jgi:hypothetical protein
LLNSLAGTGDSAGHPSRKSAFVSKNSKNAGVGRKIHFQAERYLFSPHEMAKNSSTGPGYWGRGTVLISVQLLLASGYWRYMYSVKATR